MAADFVVWPSERQAVIEHTLYPNTHKSLLLSRYIPNPTPHIIVFMFSADPTVTLASGKLLEISSDVIVKSNAASLPIIQFATIQQLVFPDFDPAPYQIRWSGNLSAVLLAPSAFLASAAYHRASTLPVDMALSAWPQKPTSFTHPSSPTNCSQKACPSIVHAVAQGLLDNAPDLAMSFQQLNSGAWLNA
ncbi:hypothetical protein EMCRGX_G033687 [Ephydatia muelleri]